MPAWMMVLAVILVQSFVRRGKIVCESIPAVSQRDRRSSSCPDMPTGVVVCEERLTLTLSQ